MASGISERAQTLKEYLTAEGAKKSMVVVVPGSGKKARTMLDPGDSLWSSMDSIKAPLKFPKHHRERGMMALMMELVNNEQGWIYHNGCCFHLSVAFRRNRRPRRLEW